MDDEAPRRSGIYRGWPIAGVTFLSLAAVLGTAQFAFGVFIIPLEEEFGWSRTQINASLTLGVLGSLTAPFLGRVQDRTGARWIMAVSLVLVAVGFFLRALMTELWQFYVISALIFTASSGATNLTAGRLVGLWFSRTRGRMMGIVTSGNNFGGMVSVPLVAALILATGWRNSFAWIGALMALIALLVFVIVRDTPEDVEKELNKKWAPRGARGVAGRAALVGLDTAQVVRLRAFWLLMTGMATQQFARTSVATQLVPHLEQEGFSTATAATAVSLLAFFAMASKIIFGRLSESITAVYAYVVIIAIQIAGMSVLTVAGGSSLAWVGLVTFGLGMGGVGALGPLAVAERFGLRNFGSILGLTRFPVIVPEVAGPIMAGMIFDARQSYDLVFMITLGFLCVSLCSFFFAAPRWSRTPALAG
jgi:sugar phosphate permease